MKKFWKVYLALLLVVLLAVFVTSCNKGDNTADTTTATEITTSGATDSSSSEPTRFNAGKVNYEVVAPSGETAQYPSADIGKRMISGGEGVVTLFNQTFDTSDPDCDGKAISRTNSGETGVVDGKLCIPYDGSTGVGGAWTTWCPRVDTNFKSYKQIQLSGKMEIVNGKSCQQTGLIGCFVDNYTFSIADNYGDGIWIAFLKDPSAICILGSDKDHWGWSTGGNVTVPVKDNALEGQFSFDIVCTSDKSTYVYINGELAASIKLQSNKIVVSDSSFNIVYTEAYQMDCADGTHFSIFGHGGGLMIDEMQVYAGNKSSTTGSEESYVKATPCEGYSLGLDITDKTDVVSICYSMWFDAIHGTGTSELKNVLNVSELLETYKFTSQYGFIKSGVQNNAMEKFHYWAEPAQGYYRSTDATACRNNMTLLYNAGVDFIILDYTYATAPLYSPGTTPWKLYIDGPMKTLLNTIMEMRAEGLGTPYVVMWLNDQSLLNDVYSSYYNVEKWKDCFVYWNSKPFAMQWKSTGTETKYFTLRGMYGLQGHASLGQWSYLEVDNSKTIAFDANHNPEHVCVCVATQETYMSEKTAHGRDGGAFWYDQWLTAFDVHPKIITLTWWNEWCAQLYNVGTDSNPYYIFTDNFNQEYSRDIEPMKGGHGDQYYQWMCEYIRCYKAGEGCPILVEEGH